VAAPVVYWYHTVARPLLPAAPTKQFSTGSLPSSVAPEVFAVSL